MSTPQAKNRPTRSTRRDVNADEQPIGQAAARQMRPTGPALESLEPPEPVQVERHVDPEKAANLAFMEEEVTVVTHPTVNPTDVRYPEVWNGGRKEWFRRGEPKRVKRKFVEVLARLKFTDYSQEKVTVDGVDTYRYIPRTALLYPFSVEEDTDKGRAWLRRVLSEA